MGDPADEALRLYLEALRFGFQVSRDLLHDMSGFLRYRAQRLSAQKAQETISRVTPDAKNLELLRLREKDYRKFRHDARKCNLWYIAVKDLTDAERAYNVIIQKQSEERVRRIMEKNNLEFLKRKPFERDPVPETPPIKEPGPAPEPVKEPEPAPEPVKEPEVREPVTEPQKENNDPFEKAPETTTTANTGRRIPTILTRQNNLRKEKQQPISPSYVTSDVSTSPIQTSKNSLTEDYMTLGKILRPEISPERKTVPSHQGMTERGFAR